LSSPALAILGGVFDPVHRGHLAMAEAVLEHLPVEEVRFVPVGVPPHKEGDRVTPAADRLALLEIALTDRPGMSIDERELHRSGPSWSIDTFRELSREFPRQQLLLLIGADNIETLNSWHRAEELLSLCIPVVATRRGNCRRFEPHHLPSVDADRLKEIARWQLPELDLDVSSSEIRRRCAEGESIAGLVPPEVVRHIEERSLYLTREV